jgi:hypothetical protein
MIDFGAPLMMATEVKAEGENYETYTDSEKEGCSAENCDWSAVGGPLDYGWIHSLYHGLLSGGSRS